MNYSEFSSSSSSVEGPVDQLTLSKFVTHLPAEQPHLSLYSQLHSKPARHHHHRKSSHPQAPVIPPILLHSPVKEMADDDSDDGHLKARPAAMSLVAEDPVFGSMSMVSPAFTPISSHASPASSLQGSELDLSRALHAVDRSAGSHAHNTELVENSLEDELPQVFCESRARIPTTSGTEIYLHLYRNNVDNKEHLAIVFGQDIHSQTLFAERPGETEQDRMTRGAYVGKLYPGRNSSKEDGARDVDMSSTSSVSDSPQTPLHDTHPFDTLVRIHSECYTGETAWSARCDCGEQLDEAARLMAKAGRGVIVYLRQEGRGIGLGEKLKAYNLQDLGADTVTANLMLRHPADARSFGLATAILLDLGLDNIRLLTNNPDKITAVEGKHKQIKVTERVPMVPLSWQNKGGFKSQEVDKYLKTKVQRMGHLLNLSGV